MPAKPPRRASPRAWAKPPRRRASAACRGGAIRGPALLSSSSSDPPFASVRSALEDRREIARARLHRTDDMVRLVAIDAEPRRFFDRRQIGGVGETPLLQRALVDARPPSPGDALVNRLEERAIPLVDADDRMVAPGQD